MCRLHPNDEQSQIYGLLSQTGRLCLIRATISANSPKRTLSETDYAHACNIWVKLNMLTLKTLSRPVGLYDDEPVGLSDDKRDSHLLVDAGASSTCIV